jgi:small subunit ribosomal protein S20
MSTDGRRIRMANIKSSKKAIKVIAKKTDNNHELKMRVKNLIKNTDKAVAAGNKEEAVKNAADLQKYMDKAVSKGLVKKNTADRKKSRIAQKVKGM